MASKELKIPIHYRKYVALREALERGGNNFDEQLQAKAEEWYQELIPEEQREKIQKQIELDDAAEAFKARQFAVVRIRDEVEDYHFTTESGEDFYSVAKYCAEVQDRGNPSEYTADTIASFFNQHYAIDETMYDVLKDAVKTDKRISAVLDIDFDIGAFSVLDAEKGVWKKYPIESIVSAAKTASVFEDSYGRDVGESMFYKNLEGQCLEEPLDETESEGMGLTPP